MARTVKSTGIALRVRKALQGLEMALDREPALFIEQNGRNWGNREAHIFLDKKKVRAEELAEWALTAGSCFRHLNYQGVRMELLDIRGGGLLVFLKDAPEAETGPSLTERERQVLVMLVKGLSNKEIARGLKVSPGTVNSHLDNVYRKLGVSGRLHACLAALNRGFAFPPEK